MNATKQIDDGGPAFPVEWVAYPEVGMSLRDYFAAQVIGHLAAKADSSASLFEDARDAYRQADAMLRARKGEEA